MDKEANAVRKEQWRRIVNDCINRDPQISKRRWCEENGIKFRSFTYWQHKFRKEALDQMDIPQPAAPAVTSPALAPAFVDVTAPTGKNFTKTGKFSCFIGADDPGWRYSDLRQRFCPEVHA